MVRHRLLAGIAEVGERDARHEEHVGRAAGQRGGGEDGADEVQPVEEQQRLVSRVGLCTRIRRTSGMLSTYHLSQPYLSSI